MDFCIKLGHRFVCTNQSAEYTQEAYWYGKRFVVDHWLELSYFSGVCHEHRYHTIRFVQSF